MLLILALAFGLMGGTVVHAQDKPKGTPLTGEDLKKLIGSGALFELKRPGERVTWFLAPRGSAWKGYLFDDGTGGQDTGTWRIVGDTLCLKFRFFPEGEHCATHYKVGDNAYEYTRYDGERFSYFVR